MITRCIKVKIKSFCKQRAKQTKSKRNHLQSIFVNQTVGGTVDSECKMLDVNHFWTNERFAFGNICNINVSMNSKHKYQCKNCHQICRKPTRASILQQENVCAWECCKQFMAVEMFTILLNASKINRCSWTILLYLLWSNHTQKKTIIFWYKTSNSNTLTFYKCYKTVTIIRCLSLFNQ